MTAPVQENQKDTKQVDTEYNFRELHAKYQRELDKEKDARLRAEKIAEEALAKREIESEPEEETDPYVDHKKLDKKLAKFGEQTKQQTQTEIQKAVQEALSNERNENWKRNNPDFYSIMQYAEKFAAKDPELAETILAMPESFERQKLVYKNIKALGLHLPEPKTSSVQDTIDQNKRSPYYQPSGVGTAPYSMGGDFTSHGKKQAFEKMQELKQRLRTS